MLALLTVDLLRASAPARVVNVTSGAQAVGGIDLEDLQFERRYRGQAASNQSKLANVLFPTSSPAAWGQWGDSQWRPSRRGLDHRRPRRPGPWNAATVPAGAARMRIPEQGADTSV